MEINTGANVYGVNGQKIGDVRHIVLDGRTQEATHIVVGKGWLLPRDIVVPLSDVEGIRPDEVRLRLTEDQLDQQPDFVEMRYVAPEAEDSLAARYARGSVLYPPLVPSAGMAWHMPYAYAPIPPMEAEVNVPEGSITLAEGMDVWAGDEKIGTIAGVRLHPRTETVSHIIISRGWLFPEERMVPRAAVGGIDERGLHLRVNSDKLRLMPAADSR